MARLKSQEYLSTMTLNEYLSNHSRSRNLDPVIIKWYRKKDATNPRKTKEEWDELILQFLSEK